MSLRDKFIESGLYIPGTTLCTAEYIFKTNIQNLRKNVGASKMELAAVMQVSYPSYLTLENYHKNCFPSFEWLTTIANFYDLQVYQLFMPSLMNHLSSGEIKAMKEKYQEKKYSYS